MHVHLEGKKVYDRKYLQRALKVIQGFSGDSNLDLNISDSGDVFVIQEGRLTRGRVEIRELNGVIMAFHAYGSVNYSLLFAVEATNFHKVA